MSEERTRVADRLRDAGIATDRFIDVVDGKKKSVDHTQREPDAVSGNYGIYATADDPLVILDIDDYDDVDDPSGLVALTRLPETLEQKSPHGGTHRLYRVAETVDGRPIANILENELGKKNPAPSWGEVRVANQYVVGAGSELDGCSKEWCDECATAAGGHYELHADREIATIQPADLVDVLQEDPTYAVEEDDGEETSSGADPSPAANVSSDADTADVLEYALTESDDEKLQRLWRGDYSDYGGDRSRAESALAYKLAFWLQGDREAVRRAMNGQGLPEGVSRPSLEKWSERTDDSYRNSVLTAVDEQTEFFEPSGQNPDPSTIDYSEVERGEAILRAETTPENPAGELQYENGCYGYEWVQYTEDGSVADSGFDAVTNFTIETLSYLETYEGEVMTLRIHPNHPMEDPYEIEVHPTVFNEARTFREEVVRGRTTWFQPTQAGNRTSEQVLSDLRQTVGSQIAPEHKGTEFIGLHDGEWVTPAGTLTADGWSEDSTYKFYEKGGSHETSSSLAEKWALEPEDGAEYDSSTVAEICEKLAWTRKPERGLPVLGWYYAAPLKPLIFDHFGSGGERQFNLLQVVGGTGTGKTSTLEMFYELFGATPNPYGCGDKGFTIEKKLSSSCGLPIWLDEYKPTDLAQGKMDWLHRRFREVFREQSLSKGLPSLGEVTFTLRAPVVFSGEQVVEKPAVRRRTIVTQFSSSSTKGEYRERFRELQSPKYDFREHALAYYRYVLSQDQEDLSALWEEARDKTDEYLEDLGVTSLNEDSETQGLQTVVFGTLVFRDFAKALGADVSKLPGEDELRDAVAHVAEKIGPDGRRREHIDDFTELVAQAALQDYLEEDVHYRIVESKKYETEALAFHMPTTFAAVKRYLQDFNLSEEYSLLGKNDFLDNYDDKAKDASAYPLGTNQQVRGIENGRKAVLIDMELGEETLGEEFTKSAFTDVQEEGEDDVEEVETASATAVSSLSRDGNPYTDVTVKVNTWDVGPDGGPAEKGTVGDATGIIDVVDWFGCDLGLDGSLEEGQCYLLEDVRVGTYDGALQLEIVEGATTAKPVDPGFGYTAAPSPEDGQMTTDAAATDGGGTESKTAKSEEASEGTETPDTDVPSDAEGASANVRRLVQAARHLRQEGDSPAKKGKLFAKFGDLYPDVDASPSDLEPALEKALREGSIQDAGGDTYAPV